MITARRAVLLVATAVVAAGCTSTPGPDDATTGSSAPATSSATSPAGSTSAGSPSTGTTSPSSSSSPASGLSTVEGSYVLAGASSDDARLYRVTGGRVVRADGGTGVTSVATGDGVVVVGRETSDAETVQQLRGGRFVSLGIGSGFGPAVSARGALAWAALGASTTPGISKPGGSVVRVRASLSGADRVVARFPSSVSGPVWAGSDLVVAVSSEDDDSARLVRFAGGRGTARTLARVANADALELTGGATAVTVATDDGAKVVSLRDGRVRAFARGWQPLCWPAADRVLASQGGQLASVPVAADGTAGTPRVLGQLPEGVRAFGGACSGSGG